MTFADKRRAHLLLGRRGENQAVKYLKQKGCLILARNWRFRGGEVDIVAWNRDGLHFVEVKTLRRKEGYVPGNNLSPRQRKRNFFAGKAYLTVMDKWECPAHYDLLTLEYSTEGKLLSCHEFTDYLPELFPPTEDRTEKTAVSLFCGEPENWFQKFLSWFNIFPCPVCLIGFGSGNGSLCRNCLDRLHLFTDQNKCCPGCGGPLDGVLSLCSNCISSGCTPLWQGCFSVFEHTGLGRKIVLDLKYNGRTELARSLGRMGAKVVQQAGVEVDCVIPVPLHWKRFLKRSYNQSVLFGQFTAKYLELPLFNCVKRIRGGSRQATLGRRARLKNLKGAFVCTHPALIRGKRILLVDDVFTTGSTLEAVTAALLKAKPAAVYVLTISRRIARRKKTSPSLFKKALCQTRAGQK